MYVDEEIIVSGVLTTGMSLCSDGGPRVPSVLPSETTTRDVPKLFTYFT